jgi:hypothetical protein
MERRRPGSSRIPRPSAVALGVALPLLALLLAHVPDVPPVGPLALVRPPVALAACGPTPSLADAVLFGDVVIVGSVVKLENDDRWATVRVEERWRGARDVPDTIVVHGGPEPDASTTTDRTYQLERYLFVLTPGDGFFVDDACTATRPWTPDLAAYRPAGVSPAPAVVAGSRVTTIDPGAIALVAALLLALLVAIVAYIVILRARRRPPDWMR